MLLVIIVVARRAAPGVDAEDAGHEDAELQEDERSPGHDDDGPTGAK